MIAALGLGLLLHPGEAWAHGIWGHVHVTAWAVENMPDDELRAFLLDDPEVFNALVFGAVFTDTGYAVADPAARAYSEHTHWEPFIEDFVEWIRVNDPPPWDSLESKKRVAFLMGCASHGLQDAIFDSLFLHQVEDRDGVGQDVTDPGTDGFLVLDEHIRFIPQQDIPLETVLELYEPLDAGVSGEVIEDAVDIVMSVYINEEVGLSIAASFGERYAEEMPWGRAHYLDAAVPGSLRAEIYPTMKYQQALWARLHDDFSADEVTRFAFPETPRRLRSGDPTEVDSWVTLVFGEGVVYDAGLVELVDDDGNAVAMTPSGNRWGGNPTRLMRLHPDESLEPGAWYTARFGAGAQTSSGQVSSEGWELRFQVACEEDDDANCPDLGEIPEASITGVPQVEDTGGDGVIGPSEPGCGCGATPARHGGLWLCVGLGAMVRRRTRGVQSDAS